MAGIRTASIMVGSDPCHKSKRCKDCGLTKSITHFYEVRKKGKTCSTTKSRCKPCHNRYNAQRPRMKLRNRIKRYKKRRECDLLPEDVAIMFTKPCHWCKRSDQPMSVDRMDSNAGYTQGNVVPSCLKCNRIKTDLCLEAWSLLLPGIRKAARLGLL